MTISGHSLCGSGCINSRWKFMLFAIDCSQKVDKRNGQIKKLHIYLKFEIL